MRLLIALLYTCYHIPHAAVRLLLRPTALAMDKLGLYKAAST
jgi:hypothetical protein